MTLESKPMESAFHKHHTRLTFQLWTYTQR